MVQAEMAAFGVVSAAILAVVREELLVVREISLEQIRIARVLLNNSHPTCWVNDQLLRSRRNELAV